MRTVALVLAAGASTRAGSVNKLLAIDGSGHTMIARSVATALRSTVERVIVVLGHDRAAIAAALAEAGLDRDPRLCLAEAMDHREGLAASLRRGIARAVACEADAALVCLGDMPLVCVRTLEMLMRRLQQAEEALACAPTLNGRRGNPVLWRRDLFGALSALTGDRGGGLLLDRHARDVIEVPVEDRGILLDFDTPARLAHYARTITPQETTAS